MCVCGRYRVCLPCARVERERARNKHLISTKKRKTKRKRFSVRKQYMMVRTLLGCQRYTGIHVEPPDSQATAYAAPADLRKILRDFHFQKLLISLFSLWLIGGVQGCHRRVGPSGYTPVNQVSTAVGMPRLLFACLRGMRFGAAVRTPHEQILVQPHSLGMPKSIGTRGDSCEQGNSQNK